jgi:hypothetical protein
MTTIVCDADLPLFRKRAPAVQSSITSMQAADALTSSRLNALQDRVHRYLQTRGPAGATDEEIADALELNPSTARPRRIELVRLGLVVRAGTRKTRAMRNADTWRAL